MPIEEDSIKKKGLTSRISVMCSCGYVKEEYTSETIVVYSNSSKGMTPFEVNTRMVYALRAWPGLHVGLENFR